MSIILDIVLPFPQNKRYDYDYPYHVILDDYQDVELVPIKHRGDCDGHLLAVGSDSKNEFNHLPCTDTDMFVATDYFRASDIPEGFSGAISYINGCTPSADIVNTVADNISSIADSGVVAIETSAAASPSFGALATLAIVGIMSASKLVHQTNAIRLDSEADGQTISRLAALGQVFAKER